MTEVFAHCDGPCGVYDPASARIAAEAVVSMTKKLLDLKRPTDPENEQAILEYHNTLARYIAIKEQEAQKCKDELLILWTDYFKPTHLEVFPKLHETFWMAAKACSDCKVHVSMESAQTLMEKVKEIHELFWKSKNREVAWTLAS
ncbi:superoxide dismutase, Ni [Candidatus Peregrinibacteria bacterium]|nr:MAG: superoxide dismutase, Ni [Candidatus Peregrinibacteria bacterium]